ncbi:MAG: hypothetical protein HRT47_01005 [Candidatus Caenarcaniphilales bacterium]|nr:hypothetical protein [Candidatus Caenarcaniphilales bacterium]
MSIVSLNTNTLTKVSNRALNYSSNKITKSVEKLATGKRINGAGDDIASLSIAAKLETRVRGLGRAQKNIVDAMSDMEIAQNGLIATSDNLQKIRDLFIQGINGTNSVAEKDMLQREINELVLNVQNSIASDTKSLSDLNILNSPINPRYDVNFQIGSNDNQTKNINFLTFISSGEGVSVRPSDLTNFEGLNQGQSPNENMLVEIKIPGASPSTNPTDGIPNTDTDTLSDLDNMLSNVNRMIAVVNAKYNYFDEAYKNVEAQKIALTGSKSHFEDTDIAEESTHIAREQIRQQSAAAMSTQANAQGQFVLSLLP